MERCKRCLLRESNEEEALKSIREKIEKLSAQERVEEDVYAHRLAACRNCDYLISGVCIKCGCYVEFRAVFKKQKCPNVSSRKW